MWVLTQRALLCLVYARAPDFGSFHTEEDLEVAIGH